MKSVWNRINRWLAAGLLLALSACDQTAPSATPAASTAADENAPPALLFAVHPYDNPSRLMARFQPLCDYLTQKLGRPVKLLLAHSYGDEIRQIARGQVDLAYMGPTPYLRAHDNYLKNAKHNVEIIAGEIQNGKANYHSVLVVPQSSPVQTVADLKNHTIAFGSPRSFSSYFVPRAMLLNNGVQLSDLKDYEFLGRHERVALAVVHGDFDAGGLRRNIADRYLDRSLRIIATSPPLPPHVIVARPGLDNAIIDQVRQALLHPGADAADALEAFSMEGRTTFSPVDDQAFDLARDIVHRIETAMPGKLP